MAETSGILECIAQDWSPTIGDPTFLGWFTVVTYGVVALLVFFAARRIEGRDRRVWYGTALLLLLLMINKQLDLQSALTAFARCHAQIYGWYEDRRPIQLAFIASVALIAAIVFLSMLLSLRGSIGRNLLLLAGLLLLLSFVAIRAAGFHHFDILIQQQIGPFQMNHVLELGSLLILFLAGLLRRPDPKPLHRRGQRTIL
jgi:hypothetical protein